MITIYSRPSCTACTATKLALERRGLTYTEVDLSDHPELVEDLRSRGHHSLPVVVTDTDEWHGLEPKKIRAL